MFRVKIAVFKRTHPFLNYYLILNETTFIFNAIVYIGRSIMIYIYFSIELSDLIYLYLQIASVSATSSTSPERSTTFSPACSTTSTFVCTMTRKRICSSTGTTHSSTLRKPIRLDPRCWCTAKWASADQPPSLSHTQ